MTKDIPFIARMIVIDDFNYKKKNDKKEDISYYNPKYDGESEYCLNTTAWD